jgi:hypothetical protein
MPYWGVMKKACSVDQYGAPPMDGSKEDDQVGAPVSTPMVRPICCIGKPWSAVKKVCGVDQYGAPPMYGSKNGQVGAPAAVPAGAPATAAVAKGPTVPTRVPAMVHMAVPAGEPTAAAVAKRSAAPAAGPVGTLTLATKKGRSAGGLGHVAAAAPTAVPTRALAATMVPTTHSWEAAAVTA